MLRIVVRSLVVVVTLLCSCLASGQNFQFRHFTEDDGLPSNTVYCVYRDSKNFLWLCTDKGVARYNGIKFEKFTTFDGLADNEIFSAEEDLQGRIWFGSYNGELCYFQNDTFHNPRNTPLLKQQYKNTHLARINIEDDSIVLFQFANTCNFSFIKNNKLTEIRLPFFENFPHVPSYIKKIASGRFRLLADNFALTIDLFPSPHIIDSQTFSASIGHIRQISDNRNQHYLFTDSGLFSNSLVRLTNIPAGFFKTALPLGAYLSSDGHWMFTSDHGMVIDDTIHVFPEKKIGSITQDIKGNYWIGTTDAGIYSFSKSFIQSSVSANIYGGNITYVKEINGQLFFAGGNGILYTLRQGQAAPVFDPSTMLPQSHSFAWYVNNDLSAWLFSEGNVLFVSDVLAKKPFIKKCRYNFHTNRESLKKIVKVQNKLYIHTGFSVQEVSLDTITENSIVNYVTLLNKRNERVFTIAAANDNAVWQSTIDKVYRSRNGKNDTPAQFKGISFKHIEFVGSYLVGCTHNNQLFVCSNINDNLKIDTIVNECVWDDLFPLDNEHVLVTTNTLNCILTVDPLGKNRPVISAIEDPFVPARPSTICVGATGCYFFKNGAITFIAKSQLLKPADPPQLFFTKLQSSKNVYPIGQAIEVPYNEAANLGISFTTLSFSGKDIIYQYAIADESGPDHWTSFKGDLNLANRHYGTYTIKMRAKTMSSAFSNPIQFQLTILRPFWATWWFIVIVCCCVLQITWLVVRLRIRSSLAKKEKEHNNHVRFIKSEYKAMNALMNPHFIFNALNNVQSLVNNKETLNATEYIGIFADLIRQNMSNISSETIPLQKEIDLVQNYLLLEKLRFEDQLNYSINVADNVFLSDIMVPPLLIQPLVENSIKHGILPLKKYDRQGFVHINIYEADEILYIEVKDNGIGLAKAKEKTTLHKSYGLENLQNRIQQLSIIQGKTISFNLSDKPDMDGMNQWTIATISVPIS